MLFISRLLSLITSSIIYCYKITLLKLYFNKKTIKKLLKETFPFVTNLIFTTIYARTSIIAISYILGNMATGYFEVAMALSLKAVIFAQILSKSLFPKLSKLFKGKNIIEFNKLAYLLLKSTLIIAIPICVILFFGAEDFINIFFSVKKFKDSILIIKY